MGRRRADGVPSRRESCEPRALEDFGDRFVGVAAAGGNIGGGGFESLFPDAAGDNTIEEARFEEIEQAALPTGDFAGLELAGTFHVLAELLDGFGEIRDALAFRGDGADYGRAPSGAFGSDGEHGFELLLKAVGSFAVGFIQ